MVFQVQATKHTVSYPHLQGEPVLQGMRSFCNKDDLLNETTG